MSEKEARAIIARAAAGRMTARFAGFAARDDVFIESQLKDIRDRP
jgi:hypothetical protein